MRLAALVPAPLLLTALLPAQRYTGENPPLVRLIATDHRCTPSRVGADTFTSLSVASGQNGVDYFAFGYEVNGSRPRIGAAELNRNTNAITLRNDFNNTTRDGDDWVALLPDVAVIGNAGVYSLSLRPNGIGAWQPRRTITNLPAGFRDATPYVRNGVLRVVGCDSTTAYDYELDPLGFVSNGITYTPTLAPGNSLNAVLPIGDLATTTSFHGYLVLENDIARARQRVHHMSSPLFDEELRLLTETPQWTMFSSITQHRGSSFLGTMCGAPGSQFPGHTVVGFSSLLKGDQILPPGGGFLLFGLALPERDPNQTQEIIAGLVLGILPAAGILIPGFLNPLGVDPLLVVGVGPVPNHVMTKQVGIMVPAGLPPGTRAEVQGVHFYPNILAAFWSNNAAVKR